MGADIHLYMESCAGDPAAEDARWSPFGGRMNPGRDYRLFALIADVRGTGAIFAPRGLPDRLGYEAEGDAYLTVNDEYADSEGYCSVANADKWVAGGYSSETAPAHDNDQRRRVSNPDWHSHTWLSAVEFRQILQAAEEDAARQSGWGTPEPRYYAVAAALESLEGSGQTARAVMWFDN